MMCGEESFGTGSNHVREKDGMWAVLAWLSILAHYNNGNAASTKFVHVEDIVRAHWATYGRNYYCRYDYEGVNGDAAKALMAHLHAQFPALLVGGELAPGFAPASCDSFSYTDPVDGSVSSNQGMRIVFTDGSRIIFRLSGTAGSGATIRMYLEKYVAASAGAAAMAQPTAEVMQVLVQLALQLSAMEKLTGRSSPSVIT